MHNRTLQALYSLLAAVFDCEPYVDFTSSQKHTPIRSIYAKHNETFHAVYCCGTGLIYRLR